MRLFIQSPSVRRLYPHRYSLRNNMTTPTKSAIDDFDYVSNWKKFLGGGTTGDFLTHLTRWLRRESRNKSRVDKEMRRFFNDSEIANSTTAVLVGYFTAIKGIHFKSQCSNDMNVLINHLKQYSHHFENFTPDQREYLSEAFNLLLDNSQPVVRLERHLHRDLFDSTLTHNSCLPLSRQEISTECSDSAKKNKREERYISPSYEGNISSPLALKRVTALILKSFDIFPILVTLNVKPTILNGFIHDLLSRKEAFLAGRFGLLFPDMLSIDDLKRIREDLNPDSFTQFSELLVWLYDFHNYYHSEDHSSLPPNFPPKPSFQSSSRSPPPADLQSEVNGSYHVYMPRSRQFFQLLQSAIAARSLTGTFPNSLISLHVSVFQDYFASLVEEFIKLETVLSFQAAELLLPTLPRHAEVHSFFQDSNAKFKIKRMIVKPGWEMASQRATSKLQKVYLFELLKERKEFREANLVHQKFQLQQYNIEPVSAREIEEQKERENQLYINYPTPVPIVVVDSLDSLQLLADEMDFTLDPLSPPATIDSDADTEEINQLLERFEVDEKGQLISPSGRSESKKNSGRRSQLTRLPIDKLLTLYRKPESEAEEKLKGNGPISSPDVTFKFFRKIIALDSEWKSGLYAQSMYSDILQLSTPHTSFIIDLYMLFRYDAPLKLKNQTISLLKKIFTDESILKLTYAFSQDLAMLAAVGKGRFIEAIENVNSIVDLQKDHEILRDKTTKQNQVGLSSLCLEYLGKPINKSFRMSDWRRRPLTIEQLHYAALDAHVQFPLFDAFFLQLGINLGLNMYNRLYPALVPLPETSLVVNISGKRKAAFAKTPVKDANKVVKSARKEKKENREERDQL